MKTMNIALKTLFGITSLAALCAATPASAVAITDSFNPPDALITSGSALFFELNITNNGFVVGLDTIDSATIAIHLTDLVVTGTNNETYRYEIGPAPQIVTCANGNCVPNPGVTDTIALNAASLVDLAIDGKISVTVSSTSGDFSFADALLTTQVTEFVPPIGDAPIGNVPEPSTLFLLGAGLAGLGSRFRRRS